MARRAVVEPEFAFFQEQSKALSIDFIVFSQNAFGLAPKILDSVDMVCSFGKTLAVVDADMAKLAHVQHVIAAQAIGITPRCPVYFSF